jgi:hypothetical protein
MLRTKFRVPLLLMLFALVCALNATAQNNPTKFKGSIGQSRFEMTLQRDGGQLDGSYFYTKVGSAHPLTLRGRIDADGKFTMREFDAAGKQTGEFSGAWKEDPNAAGASLEGEWKKPNDKKGQPFSASEQMIFFNGGAQIINRQTKESFKAKRLDVTAEYPELSGGANVSGFNQLVRERVAQITAPFKKEMLAQSAEDLKTLPAGMNNYIDISYDIEYADDDLISVSFLADTFAGGAHPNQNYFTITYDLKDGRELKLADLFKPGAKYLERISAYATKDLQSRKVPDSNENAGLAQDIWEDGAKPKPENYARWNITRKGLIFTFDPYQVGAYAFGPQFVIVPYARLTDIARPDGALAKIVKR